MFTVALIGLDGAGKTTVCRRIEQAYPGPIKYLYMGVNTGSSNRMLLTTRLAAALKNGRGKDQAWQGPPTPGQARSTPKGLLNHLKAGTRATLRLANRLIEEMYRQIITWSYLWRGNIVLYDRHFFFDYYTYDIAPNYPDRPLSRRLHGLFLQHIYPKPNLVIFLDAPAEVVFARKGEGTIEDLNRRRQEYLHMGSQVKHFFVVDATQPVDQVMEEVMRLIYQFPRLKQASRGDAQPAHE